MSKFVIFASARTGSTSLAKVLGECPGVSMAIEPFHPGYPEWNPGRKNYSALITDAASMNAALDELLAEHDAIKVLDYQFPEELYFTLLTRLDLKVLFLTRRNLAAQAVSSQMGHQTGVWQKSDRRSPGENSRSVDLAEIARLVEGVGAVNARFAEFLAKNRPDDHLPLFYEALYSEDLEQNRKTLERICGFVGISLPPDEAIRKHMTSSQAKINYEGLYKQIPNYREIVERFGEI